MVCANLTCSAVRLPRLVVREQLREDQRGVQRRAQLVAHVGQELALVLVRALELRRLLRERRLAPAARPADSPGCSPAPRAARWSARAPLCCASSRACDSLSAWPCSSSSSLVTRSSSCCVCSSSAWRWVSSSSSSSRVRSFEERTAMPIDSRTRRRSSRSAATSSRKKPSSITACTAPRRLAGAISRCRRLAVPERRGDREIAAGTSSHAS